MRQYKVLYGTKNSLLLIYVFYIEEVSAYTFVKVNQL